MAERTISYVFKGQFTNLSAGLTAASVNVKQFGNELNALDAKGAKMRAGLETLGGIGGRVALGLGAGLAFMVAKTANFDQAMSNVAATGDDARSSLDALREAAIDAGASTAFSATEAANGIENLVKAGVSADDVLAGGLAGALDLAAAGGLEVADAAEIAATALTQFRLSGADVPHVADLLAAGAGKAQGEVSDLSAALGQSGLVASQMGLSIEETVGTLASFASAGLLGSDAGTSFRTMLLRLANPTKESAELMQELGINAYDATGQFVGMESIATQLQTAFEGKTQAERDSALATLFGSDAIRAAAVLYEQGGQGIETWTNNVNDAGYASETAATRMDNLKGDLEELGGALETAFIGAGDGSTGILRELTQGATGLVNAFNALPGPVKTAASGLAAVVAVTGGAAWFGSKVITGIADTKQALADLGVTSPKAASGLARLGRAATIAGLAFAGLEIASSFLGESTELPGAEATERAMKNVAKGADDTGSSLDDLFTREAGSAAFYNNASQQISGLDDALSKLAESDFRQFASTDVLSALGFSESKYDLARESVANLDEAMAGLVSSGNSAGAAAVFQEFADAANRAGMTTIEARALLPQYGDALIGIGETAGVASFGLGNLFSNMAALSPSARDGGAANEEYAAGTDAAAEAAAAAKGEVNALATEMRNQAAEARGAFDAQTQWGQAVMAAREQAKSGQQGLDAFTEAGQANRQALSGLASAWEQQPRAVKNSTAAYRDARQTFLEVADQMGVGEQKAKRLARSMLEVPRRVVSEARVDDKQAKGAIRDTDAGLKRLDKTTADPRVNVRSNAGEVANQTRTYLNSIEDEQVFINVIRRVASAGNAAMDAIGGALGGADGATVPGQRQPYGDKLYMHVAPGEEIISNRHGQADKNREALKAANRGARIAVVGAAAEGATVPGLRGMARDTYSRTPRTLTSETLSLDGIAQFDRTLQITSMTMGAFEDRMNDSVKGEKGRQDKRRDLFQKELDESKARLEAIKSERESLEQAVRDRFKSDIFGREQDAPEIDPDMDPYYANLIRDMRAQNAVSDAAMGLGNSPASLLQQQISQAMEYDRLVQQLVRMGFDGGALREAMEKATPDELRALIAGGSSQLERLERLYDRRERVLSRVGGNAAEGAGLVKAQQAAVKEVRESNQRLKQLEKKQDRANELAETNPRLVGREFDRVINGAASRASRRSGGRYGG